MPGIDDAAREELRLTLKMLPEWQLSDEGWQHVERLLRDVHQAMSDDDRPAFYRTLQRVDDAGPTRLARLGPDEPGPAGSGVPGPPPKPVVELINSLVHPPSPGRESV